MRGGSSTTPYPPILNVSSSSSSIARKQSAWRSHGPLRVTNSSDDQNRLFFLMATSLCEPPPPLAARRRSARPLSPPSKSLLLPRGPRGGDLRPPAVSPLFLGRTALRRLKLEARASGSSSGVGRRQVRAMASLGGLLGGIFKGSDTGESTRQQCAGTVSVINGLEAEMSALSDSGLRDRTSVLRQRAQQGESLDSLLPVSVGIPELILILKFNCSPLTLKSILATSLLSLTCWNCCLILSETEMQFLSSEK